MVTFCCIKHFLILNLSIAKNSWAIFYFIFVIKTFYLNPRPKSQMSENDPVEIQVFPFLSKPIIFCREFWQDSSLHFQNWLRNRQGHATASLPLSRSRFHFGLTVLPLYRLDWSRKIATYIWHENKLYCNIMSRSMKLGRRFFLV